MTESNQFPESHDYATVLTEVIAVAREAAALIRAEFYRPGGPRGTPGHCPVDEQVELLICERLRARFPSWPFYGEETGLTGEPSLHHWLVDPQDGTSAFQRGYRGSAVSIALLRGAEPVLGVVLAPCPPVGDEDLIVWAEGCGPVRRNGVPVERRWPEALDREVVVVVSQEADKKAPINAELVAPARYRALPSVAYRLALVGAGEGDVAVSVANPNDYDFAAGHAIIKGAGGILVDAAGQLVKYAPAGGRQVSVGGVVVGGGAAVARELAGRPWRTVHSGFKDEGPFVWPRRDRIAPRTALERAHGIILGQLVGDALGAQVEFQTAAAIAARYPQGVRTIRDGGSFDTLAGQPTDDSELALALARAILRQGTYEAGAVARAYVEWYQSGPFDIGMTVGAACAGGARALDQGLDVASAMRAAANAESQSNGALMRASPLGVAGYRDTQRAVDWAIEDAELSHPHQVCVAANAAFVGALSVAVSEAASPAGMLAAARAAATPLAGGQAVLERLSAAETAPPAGLDAEQMGWVLHALQNAFYELLTAPSSTEGLVATVGRGGDTDTNGAIAGALLGAYHGATAVPVSWRQVVLSCRPTELTGRRPRPARYWPVDALTVASELLMRFAAP